MVDTLANPILSDGRPMRAMKDITTQKQMFQLLGKFNPKDERIANVRDVDDALNAKRVYKPLFGDRWVRTREYGLYRLDQNMPLGPELLWVEQGITYKKLVPDVPVLFYGKEMSLQKLRGAIGLYDSIDLLQIAQTDNKEFTISAMDPAALAGRVMAVRFVWNDWALTDDNGLPDVNKTTSADNPEARYGWVRTNVDAWHGSLVRYDGAWGGRRSIYLGAFWSEYSAVAIVGRHEARNAPESAVSMPIEG